MTKRKPISTRERARLFMLHGGICHMCGHKIDGSKERWEVSHVIEWRLTQDDSDENRKPAHYKCHRDYTYSKGNPMLAKVERLRLKNMGIRPQPTRKIQSRGFPKPATTRSDQP